MNPTTDADLAAKLERLRRELASQASSIRRGNILTLLLGFLALGALGAYFYWGYSQFSEVLQHERLADTVTTLVDDNVPGVRKSLEDEARKSAPAWAEGLSKQLRDGLPMGRKKLEDYVIDRTKATLEEGAVLTQEQFTRFLQANKATLQRDIADLAKGPNLADEAIVELEKSLQAQLDSDLKMNANEMVYILTAFNDKLSKLAKNQKLDQTEAIERRLAMIARRVQSDQISTAGPALVTDSSVPPAATRVLRAPRSRTTEGVEKAKAETPAGDAKPQEAPKEEPK
jgi:hypothetical protein